eukprot:CAMPEP_0177560950 /NCGR_PEP_ID=MMETSP0369-20130122/71660_1 /TAXON_ID=447022 ORGANISM="Scrippsiella hangoei-like, Strain SHHI-4" /NCGR_SAMPLE_ID=MMETSP0369 /ASSEMBLY_ACC=CAM_ASM_000364 /LENGTH=83 /DNA_ID=CAMNT_0019047815 /DNA_START=1 /DNA_END=249 /DNA_ORIENTATION=+
MVRVHGHLGLALSDEDRKLAFGDTIAGCWATLTPRVGGGELCALGVASPSGRPCLAGLALATSAMHRALRAYGAEGISTGGFQ